MHKNDFWFKSLSWSLSTNFRSRKRPTKSVWLSHNLWDISVEKTVENIWVDRVSENYMYHCVATYYNDNRQQGTPVFTSCRYQGNTLYFYSSCILLRIETPFTVVLNACNLTLLFVVCTFKVYLTSPGELL